MRSVGGYQLLRRIGCGGMSSVYEAVNDGGDHVALKLLHPSLAADEESRVRLRREVNVLRRVRSPYVAEIIDAELDAVEPFIVTELIDGLTLEKDVQENGIYTEEDLLRLGEQLGEALRHVHKAGVLHRDLKPSNVMIADGKPILIDFGIAQAHDATRLTQQGALALTPGYCDPRVIRGAQPDEAADWWAMAAVLAYAASGEPPFGQGNAPAVMRRVLQDDACVPDVGNVVAIAFRYALAADPQLRCTYDELLDAIRNPTEETFVAAPPELEAAADEKTFVTAMPPLPPAQYAFPEEAEPLLLPAQHIASDQEENLPLPDWARDPRHARITVTLAWVGCVALSVRAPQWCIALAIGAVFICDIVGASFAALRDKRLRRGAKKAADTPLAVLRFPVTLAGAMLRTAGASAVIAGVGYAVLWLSVLIAGGAGSGVSQSGGIRALAWGSVFAYAHPLFVTIVIAASLILLWFSPTSKKARLGARIVTGGRASSRIPRVLCCGGAILFALLAVLSSGVLM